MPRPNIASPALTREQIREYRDSGIVLLPKAVQQADINLMADKLWDELARKFGVLRNDTKTWTKPRPAQLQALARGGAFAPMITPLIRDAIDHVLGAGNWDEPSSLFNPLVSFRAGNNSWEVPRRAWHVDAALGVSHPPLARVFVLLAPIEPQGGGTMMIAGSHILTQRLADEAKERKLSSEEVRETLKARYRWFEWLCSRTNRSDRTQLMSEAEVGGVKVRAVEMTGEAGDAYLMHPCVLHASTPIVRDTPRLVVSLWASGRGDTHDRRTR